MQKTSKQNVNKMVASAGDADPGQEGFGEGRIRQRSRTPLLGWAGGFNVLRTDGRVGVGLHSIVARKAVSTG